MTKRFPKLTALAASAALAAGARLGFQGQREQAPLLVRRGFAAAGAVEGPMARVGAKN